MVHSGRPLDLPNEDDPVLRNEGVGIVMSPVITVAWRSSGECWKAVSSRIVYAPLNFQHCGYSRERSSRNIYLSVVSVYAPTYHAPLDQKDAFYDDLSCTIN